MSGNVLARIASVVERIAIELESRSTDVKIQNYPSTKETLQELLQHCERQAKACEKRSEPTTHLALGREKDVIAFLAGQRKARDKWIRFANLVRAVLDSNTTSD